MQTASHGPQLSRMHTAPTMTTRATAMNHYPNSTGHTPRTSTMSPAPTAHPSSASLSTMGSSATLVPQANGGPVVPTTNIINQQADASRSLYQVCVTLIERLRCVPGFEEYMPDLDDDNVLDPMKRLWDCLKQGWPLLTLMNILLPDAPLTIDTNKYSGKNIPKRAGFLFLEAFTKEFNISMADAFGLVDLLGKDTSGFVRVAAAVNKVLDVAELRGLLLTSNIRKSEEQANPAGTKMSFRDYVVRELVDTERKYVQDLENLHELKQMIERKAVIAGDLVHDIFLNINAILDFQRRFLIRIETTNSLPEEKQEWGTLFYNVEDSFGIYQPFIANQRRAVAIAKREFDKLFLANHPVVVNFQTLDGFLLKPMQRLIKYPQLLKSLRDKAAKDEETKAELTLGIDAAERILEQANDAVDRELRNEAMLELLSLVDDWKNHEPKQFGDLLLYGQFTVQTGKSDLEKEYHIYLFERILLCCKEVNPNKQKEKLLGPSKKDKKEKEKRERRAQGVKPAKLQLKGRIFMTNVTTVVAICKTGSYTLQIFWKGDIGVENFVIRFTSEEVINKWCAAVNAQREKPNPHDSYGENGHMNFAWTAIGNAPTENPYAGQYEDDEDDVPPYSGHSGVYSSSRNGSSSSLRSRSATADSSQSSSSTSRPPPPPPRFPMPQPPLSLQTQLPGVAASPSQRAMDSYFSPTQESPASSRTSQSSNMFPFPRQGTPQGSWEEHNRYTAPAIARAPSRESQQMGGRGQRPSLSGPSAAAHSSQRSRSYSTPDINGPTAPARRLPNGTSVPAVPGIPAHLHSAYDPGIPRSNTNSPINNLPMRANTQSPGVQRERLLQQQNSGYASAPNYLRSNTTPVHLGGIDGRTMPPHVASTTPPKVDTPLPTQLKVKVNCEGNYVTLVVAFNISYQSLIDRIDAKVGRFSNKNISQGTMRLRYKDEDGDFVTIESDDDIQIAFQEWREAQHNHLHTGQLGEIELFCAVVDK